LSALTIRCIMHPRTVGFDVKNVEMTDKLPHVLETLLNSMRLRYNYDLPDIFKKCLLSFVQKYVTKLLDLHDIMQNDSCDDLIQHVNGLILLKRCDMLDRTVLETSTFTNGDHTITQIFEFLISKRIEELTCRDLNARMIEYLRALMEFQFSLLSLTIEMPVIIPDDVRSMIDTLVKLMSNDVPVISVDCTTITHGEYFMNTFRSVIFKYMLAHVSAITDVFDNMSRDNPSFLLKWIEDLLLFLKQHKRELQAHDTIIDAILQQFTYLKNAVFNVDSRKERLINIYSIAVHLKSNPMEVTQNHEFYRWIQEQLMDDNDLEYKIKILKNFFICLTDMRQTDHKYLQMNLRTLRRSLCSNLSETSVNAMKVIDCFETLLVLLSTTRSMIMLKYVIYFAAGVGNRLFDDKLEEHLRGYYYRASLEHVLESLQQTYHMFMKVNITEMERLDILHGFLLPAFKFCDAIAIERFFEKNIEDLHDEITKLDITDFDDAIKQKIVSKIGCFQLIAILFARVDKNKIDANGSLSQLNKILINRERYRNMYASTENIRSLRIMQPECQELARLLHCSAYNCLLAIISLKEEERFYNLAFRNAKNGFFNWENIIDCNTQYMLGQTFKEYPKTREITVNIRSAEVDKHEQRMHRYAYVHSYDLSACTLSEDINAYDLNKCVVLPSDFCRPSTTNSTDSDPLRTHDTTSITLTNNDFNEHECMPYICVLLRHIRKTFRLSDKEPEWLMFFFKYMQYDNRQNIQLFMLKIISNTADEVFKPYARFALTKIIKVVANYLERYDLNYIITDVLEILMDWNDVIVSNNEESKAAAQRLFEKFINKVFIKGSDGNNRVYNYNLSLIRTMVEKWRNCLRVSNDFLNQQMISAPSSAVYLILVLFDNDMMEEIVAIDDIINFLLKSLKANLRTPNTEVPLQCCECLGLYLRSLDNGRHDETERDNKKHEVKDGIFDILGSASLSINVQSMQIKCIAALCRTYSEVAVDYINVIISAMAKGVKKSYCLEIFTLAMPRLDANEVVSKLHHMKLQEILTNRIPSCEKLALRIVRDIVAILLPKDLFPYMSRVIPYVKDNITEHRELVYDIFMRLHKRYSANITVDDDAIMQNLLSISMRNLLTGVLDPSHELQDRILKFWTEERSLNTERSKDRLVALLDMPQITEEDSFAPFVALLMLQLTTKSIDYTRKMFDAPLQDSSTFEEYRIAVSWRRRNLNCVTPMFVDSLASQMSYNTFSQSVDNDLRGTYMTPTFSYPRISHGVRLRATQDLQFEPTLFDNNDDPTTSYDTGLDRTIIASSSRQSLQTPTRHERFTRILASKSDVTNRIRDAQIRKNVQQEERIKQENIRQRSSVKLYR